MALVALLFVVSSLLHAHGSSAVMFVKKGEDLPLNVMNAVPDRLLLLEWKHNKNGVLVQFIPASNPEVFPDHRGRIEFPLNNYSVILKDLKDTDSGVYTARVTRRGAPVQILDEYNVTVQAPVSPATLTVDSVSTSSVSCNLTVSCRAQDAHINTTFTCDNQTCSQEGGERSEVTTSGSTLHVYLGPNDTIICNHSNQVSWTKDMIKIQDFCLRHNNSHKSKHITVPLVVSFGLILTVCAVVLACYLCKKIKNNSEGIDNTIYEIPEVRPTAQPRGQIPTVDSSGLSPTSTYSTVGPHTGPEAPETRGTAQPESLYAQVKHPKSSNNGSGI